MKKIYLFILLSTFFIKLPAQTFEWAKREGLWAYDYGYGIVTDVWGNVYVAGKYEMAADFSGTILPDRGNHDIYVAQYNSSGTLNWIKTAGGTLGDYAHALAYDGWGSICIAGEIEGYGDSVSFDGSSIKLNCVGDNDVFVAKYDVYGTLIWAKSAGGYWNDKALGVTYDNLGNVYVCGVFIDTAFFETSTIYGHIGGKDIFVAKYDTNGNFQWVRQAGGPGQDEAKAIKCDAFGNIYVCGMYSDSTTFGSTLLTTPNTPTGHYFNTFLSKYSADGTLQWVKTAGGDYDDVAWGLTIDKTNKIYIAGEFNAYAHFDSIPLTTTGNANVFVACYEADGTAQWATSGGGELIDRARGIGTDGTDLYITGQFGDTATFGNYTLIGADSSDIFMARLNNAGNFIWAIAIGGMHDSLETLSYESGNSITADTSGNVFATGSLLDGGIFGSTVLSEWGRTDAFITKISQANVNVAENNDRQQIRIYPNPNNGNFTIDLSQFTDQKIEMIIYDCLGQIIYKRKERSSKINIDLQEQRKGIYFLEVINEDHQAIRCKLIFK